MIKKTAKCLHNTSTNYLKFFEIKIFLNTSYAAKKGNALLRSNVVEHF